MARISKAPILHLYNLSIFCYFLLQEVDADLVFTNPYEDGVIPGEELSITWSNPTNAVVNVTAYWMETISGGAEERNIIYTGKGNQTTWELPSHLTDGFYQLTLGCDSCLMTVSSQYYPVLNGTNTLTSTKSSSGTATTSVTHSSTTVTDTLQSSKSTTTAAASKPADGTSQLNTSSASSSVTATPAASTTINSSIAASTSLGGAPVANNNSNTSTKPQNSPATTAGIVLGAIGVTALLVIIVLLLYRHRQRKSWLAMQSGSFQRPQKGPESQSMLRSSNTLSELYSRPLSYELPSSGEQRVVSQVLLDGMGAYHEASPEIGRPVARDQYLTHQPD